MADTKRTRRGEDELIRELEAKIASIKSRAARKAANSNPTTRHTAAAVKALDKALQSCDDAATKKALQEARATLSACLALDGALVPAGPSSRTSTRIEADALLSYVRKNPGQRGEQIASALGTDAKAMRPVMQKLIADRRVKTKGDRRGMTYAAV